MSKKETKTATAGPPIDAPKSFKMSGAYTRKTLTLTLTWDYPKSASDKKSANRWEGTVLYLAVDTNVKENKVVTSTLETGVKGYTKWKTTKKGKKKTQTLYSTDSDGKLSGKYKGKVDKNKVSDVKKSTTKTTVLENKRLSKGVKKKKYTYKINLEDYYPKVSKKRLDAVICMIQGYNKYSLVKAGSKTYCRFNKNVPWALYQVSLEAPVKPAIESNYVESARKINFVCTAKQPGSGKHWYRTDWTLNVVKYSIDSKTKKNKKTILKDDSGQKDTLEFNQYWALPRNELQNMNTKVEVHFSAKAKGAWGASKTAKEHWTFAYPHQKKIGFIEINGDLVNIPYVDESDGVNNENRYTSTVWLERLPDFVIPDRILLTATDATWQTYAAMSTSWEKVGGDFDPSIGRFIRSASLDKPGVTSPYSRTYYRIGAKNASFDMDEFYVYSNPKPCPGYATIPTPANDTIDFLECVPEKNGTSVRVVLAYHVTYQNELPTSDGCEVSWSDDYNSWRSNSPPATFDMPDIDSLGEEYFRVKKPATVTPASDEMYNYWLIPDSWTSEQKNTKLDELTGLKSSGHREFTYTSKAYIMGLTEGVKYYFRARRYLEESNDLPRLYGPYADYSSNLGYEDAGSAAKLVQPATIPENVKLKVSSPVPVGKDLELVWTFEGDGTQTEWDLKRYVASDVVEVEATGSDTAKAWKLLDTAVGVSVKTSKDAAGYTLLPYNTTYNDDGSVKELGISEYLEDNVVFFVVGTKTTGDFGYSAPVQVRYVEPPSASLGVASVLSAQPLSLSIGSNISGCSATVRVSAVDSVVRQAPEGLKSQPSGYIVYSNKYETTDLNWNAYSGPSAPTSQVSGSNSSGWSTSVPDYDEHCPNYYRCYQYSSSGTHWTTPELDRPLSEVKLLGSTAVDPIRLWFAGKDGETPSVPYPVNTEQTGYIDLNPAAAGWLEMQGVEDNRYYVATTDTEVSSGHVYYEMCGASSTSTSSGVWTSVIPAYDSTNPVYYYCYGFKVGTYEGQDRYAWTEVAVDAGMTQLKASGVSSQNITTLWNPDAEAEYFANIMLPPSLELLNGARYQVSLVLEDPETKLDSKKPDSDDIDQPMRTDFVVDYSRVASTPNSNHVFIFSNQEASTTNIQIVKPERHVPGDVYDIYRVTPDGVVKIGTDISPGQVVKDLFAPFSSNRESYSNPDEKAVNLRYRVAVRTPDGTEAWRDFLYSLKNTSIRFDWGGVNASLMEYTSLTIPYNLSYTDTFKKYFEARHHMGDRLPVGFWTESLDRTGSISTDMIKYDNPRDKEALKSLAGYSGPVFVRRPDGCAYLANVEMNSYSVSYDSPVIPVSFDISEIELTTDYMIPQGSYLFEEDQSVIDGLSVEPDGFYDTLLLDLVSQ